jgi:hypothetical protein
MLRRWLDGGLPATVLMDSENQPLSVNKYKAGRGLHLDVINNKDESTSFVDLVI